MTIQELAEQKLITVDYSDDDIIIIDNIKQLAEPNPTRIRMNIIAIAKQGRAQISVNGHNIMLGENQLLLCPPGTMFTDFLFSADFEFKALFLTNSIIQSFLREKINIWNEMMYIHKMHVVSMEPRDVNFFYSFYDIIRQLIDAPTEKYPYRTETIQAILRGAILGLCGALKMMMPEQSVASHAHGDTLFQRFLDLVNSSQRHVHTVEAFASELCVSPKYLSSICKKNSGKTAYEWIREHMIEEIRYYLKQTDMPMKQIADELGFANPSFFGKYVKDHLGMTPLQYRRK